MMPATAPFVRNDARLTFNAAAHRYMLGDRELISVTTALKHAGLVETRWYTEEARERGTALHATIAAFVRGEVELFQAPNALQPYLAGFEQFLLDSGTVVEHSERLLCDPTLGYAGTVDLVVRWPETARRTVIDMKSGSVPPFVGPQTAAYSRCVRDFYPAGTFFGRAALHLPGDGQYRLVPLDDVSDEPTFLAALRIARFRRDHDLLELDPRD